MHKSVLVCVFVHMKVCMYKQRHRLTYMHACIHILDIKIHAHIHTHMFNNGTHLQASF